MVHLPTLGRPTIPTFKGMRIVSHGGMEEKCMGRMTPKQIKSVEEKT